MAAPLGPPPWPSIGLRYRWTLCVQKKPIKNCALVSFATQAYHGTKTTPHASEAQRTRRSQIKLRRRDQRRNSTAAAVGTTIATGPLASMPSPDAAPAAMSQRVLPRNASQKHRN